MDILKKIKRSFASQRIYEDDTFIASFPKSGNTWVRFILSHILINCDHQLNFSNYDHIIPEIDIHKDFVLALKRPRILKTHKMYDERMKKAIYIVRDPRDVYVSYYYYLRKSMPEDITISCFLKDQLTKPNNWSNHVDSWQDLSNSLTVRYEDIHSNTLDTVLEMIDFLNINATKETVQKAISMSSFDNLSKVEDKFGRNFKNEKAREKSSKFMRKGKTNQWKEVLSESDANLIMNTFSTQVDRFEYK